MWNSRLLTDKAERLSRSNRASVLRAPATSHPRRGAADRGRPRSHLPRRAAAAASGRGRRTQPRTASARRGWREGVGWMDGMPSTGTSSAPATDTPGGGWIKLRERSCLGGEGRGARAPLSRLPFVSPSPRGGQREAILRKGRGRKNQPTKTKTPQKKGEKTQEEGVAGADHTTPPPPQSPATGGRSLRGREPSQQRLTRSEETSGRSATPAGQGGTPRG